MKSPRKKSHSFRYSILTQIVPWISVILIGVSFFFFYYSFRILKNEKEKSTEIIVSEKADEFERYFTEIKSTLVYVASEPVVKNIVERYPDMDAIQQLAADHTVKELANLNVFKAYMEDIFIIGTNGYYTNLLSYSELKANCRPLEWDSIQEYQAGENTYFDYVLPHEVDYYVSKPHKVFSVVLPIYSGNKIVGYVQGNLNYNDMLEKFQTKNIDGMEIIVINEEEKVVFSADETAIGQKANKDYLNYIYNNEGVFVYPGHEREMVVYRKSENTNWYFMAVVSYESLLAPGYVAAKVLLFGVLPATIILMIFIIFALSREIRQPIQRLLIRVEEVDPEHYIPVAPEYGVQEIDILGMHFEKAMQHIYLLIQNVYQAEIRKKDAEFAVLRSQITPHFLYNSLQLIKAEALLSKNQEISRIITALANLLRYTMDSKTSIVSVEDECAYIRDYLEIYQRRFIGKFDYRIDINEQIISANIPKLILQPLIENSIKHGLRDIKEGGIIRVLGYMDGEDCLFEIYDNGCGINQDKIHSLYEEFEGEIGRSSGIGMCNVHHRIVMLNGEGYGVQKIESTEDTGTRIIVRVKYSVGEKGEPDV